MNVGAVVEQQQHHINASAIALDSMHKSRVSAIIIAIDVQLLIARGSEQKLPNTRQISCSDKMMKFKRRSHKPLPPLCSSEHSADPADPTVVVVFKNLHTRETGCR